MNRIDADKWAVMVDEDFYFMYSVEVYDDGTVQFILNDTPEDDD